MLLLFCYLYCYSCKSVLFGWLTISMNIFISNLKKNLVIIFFHEVFPIYLSSSFSDIIYLTSFAEFKAHFNIHFRMLFYSLLFYLGLIDMPVPFRQYNYQEYYPKLFQQQSKKQWLCYTSKTIDMCQCQLRWCFQLFYILTVA